MDSNELASESQLQRASWIRNREKQQDRETGAVALLQAKRLKLIIVDEPDEQSYFKELLRNEKGFIIYSTGGCIRQLDDSRPPVPPDYVPNYVVKKMGLVKQLLANVEKADQVVLATDSEANAWHLKVVLGLRRFKKARLSLERKKTTTPALIKAIALAEGEIVENHVRAHEARLVIDHLAHIKISDWLSKKLGIKQIAVGRLQALAINKIVQREREIQDSKNQSPSRYTREELISGLHFECGLNTSRVVVDAAIVGCKFLSEDGKGQIVPSALAFKIADELADHFSFMKQDYIETLKEEIVGIHFGRPGFSYKSVVANFDSKLMSELRNI